MATGYLANWGNDSNDGLSRITAKRSFQGIINAGLNPCFVEGFYNENPSMTTENFDGQNKTIVDGTLLDYMLPIANFVILSNITFQNFNRLNSGSTRLELINCVIRNMNIFLFQESGSTSYGFSNSVFYNIPSATFLYGSLFHENNTWHSIGGVMTFTNGYFHTIRSVNNIISQYSIEFKSVPTNLKYFLFLNTKFKFTGGGLGNDELTFEYPTGATDMDKFQNLKDRIATVYGGLSSDYLFGCQYYSGSYNDIFVDADYGDFHLVPNCIAAHMSYNGDYIGAKFEGHKYDWNSDWTNIVNIDSNGNIIDQTLDASAESNVIDIGYTRHITDVDVLGIRAARNGQQVNTVTNLGSEIAAGSNVLTAGKVYQCLNDTVTLDGSVGTTFQPFECYYAIDDGGGSGNNDLGFSGLGIMKEVLISDSTPKIQLKCSKTDPTLSSAVLITSSLYESPLMVNVDVNGEPTHGSQDVGYNVGTAVDLYTKYIKFYITIKANNLAAR